MAKKCFIIIRKYFEIKTNVILQNVSSTCNSLCYSMGIKDLLLSLFSIVIFSNKLKAFRSIYKDVMPHALIIKKIVFNKYIHIFTLVIKLNTVYESIKRRFRHRRSGLKL